MTHEMTNEIVTRLERGTISRQECLQMLFSHVRDVPEQLDLVLSTLRSNASERVKMLADALQALVQGTEE